MSEWTIGPRQCASTACTHRIPRHWRKRYCSPACRDHDHRPGPRRFAYADPPYPGQSYLYKDHPDFAGEVDHRELVDRLLAEFPDGWALSTSSRALQEVWGLCPDARLGIWVKEFVPMKPTLAVQHGWEAVLWQGGRPRDPISEGIISDYVRANPVAYRQEKGGVIGMKPPAFCRWLFLLLGAQAGDELVDLYPGSGGVQREWDRFRAEPPLAFAGPGNADQLALAGAAA